MRRLMLATLAVIAMGAVPGHAADQLVLGRDITVRATNSGLRKVICRAQEPASINTIVGNPTITGATARIKINGTTSSDQTWTLPASKWTANATGFVYADVPGGAGPVRCANIMKSGSNTFRVRILARGTTTTPSPGISVVPPNTGTDAQCVLSIVAGDQYCYGFGGVAGGTVTHDNAVSYVVKSPISEITSCP
jgi:hypothetical protein